MPKTLAVEFIGTITDETDIPENGIVSCEVIPIEELDDETLELMFVQSPEWVMEFRPDWVKQHKHNQIH